MGALDAMGRVDESGTEQISYAETRTHDISTVGPGNLPTRTRGTPTGALGKVGGARYPSIVKNAATYLPAAFFFAFFLGANSANTQMWQSSNTHRIEFAGTTEGRGEEEIRLLRGFQDWVLVRDEGGKVAWIPANNVGRIQLLDESEAFGGLVCVFFSTRWCRDG